MNSGYAKYRALAWEQAVVTGSICGLALLLHLFVALTTRAGVAASMTKLSDAAEMSGTFGALGALLVAALTCIVRQNVAGELALDFEPRLRRLPVKTLPLVMLVFSVRCASLFGLAGAVCLVQWAVYRELPDRTGLFLLLGGYLILQTLVWTRQSLTGIDYAVPLGLLAWATAGLAMNRQYVGNVLEVLATPLSLAGLTLLAFVVSLAGIALLRRDARAGLPKPVEIHDAVAGFRGAPDRPFRNALSAQAWFERQRGGWLLLLGWAAFSAVMAVLARAFLLDDREAYIYQWLPYLAVLLTAPIAGSIVLSEGAGILFSRPIETRHIALAKLIALFQSLGVALLLAFGLSTVLFVWADTETWELMNAAWAAREIDLAGLAAWLLGPLLLVSFAAWGLLFLRTREFVLLVVVMGVLVLVNLGIKPWSRWVGEDSRWIEAAEIWPLLAAAVLFSLVQFWRCARAALLPLRALEFAALLVFVCTVFAGLYVGAVQFDLGFLWFGVAAGAILALPGAAVTRHLNRTRHR